MSDPHAFQIGMKFSLEFHTMVSSHYTWGAESTHYFLVKPACDCLLDRFAKNWASSHLQKTQIATAKTEDMDPSGYLRPVIRSMAMVWSGHRSFLVGSRYVGDTNLACSIANGSAAEQSSTQSLTIRGQYQRVFSNA